MGSVLKFVGGVALLGALRLMSDPAADAGRGAPVAKSVGGPEVDDGHSKTRDLATYGVGYGLALVLTCLAFALVHWQWATGVTAFRLVLALGFIQMLVHFRCFLHVDLKRSARDDLQLILFSTVIVALMVGGTLVVLFNLRTRMM